MRRRMVLDLVAAGLHFTHICHARVCVCVRLLLCHVSNR